jgi:hypothetical protein
MRIWTAPIACFKGGDLLGKEITTAEREAAELNPTVAIPPRDQVCPRPRPQPPASGPMLPTACDV